MLAENRDSTIEQLQGEDYYWCLRRVGGNGIMGNRAVTLRVAPFVRVECKFWVTDDGWNGSCEQPSITVHAGTFEHAKSEMEIALGKHVESLLGAAQRGTGQAA